MHYDLNDDETDRTSHIGKLITSIFPEHYIRSRLNPFDIRLKERRTIMSIETEKLGIGNRLHVEKRIFST